MILFALDQPAKLLQKDPRAPFTECGALRLIVRGESFFANCRDSLAVLARRSSVPSSVSPVYFRRTGLSPSYFRGSSVGASILAHGLFIGLLVFLPRLMPASATPRITAEYHEERIYYRVPLLDPAALPRIAPAGPGGHPGSGSVPAPTPTPGSTTVHPSMTIISKPIHPDNSRQTIYQASSPPELKIQTEQKLPNIVSLPPVQAPKATLNFDIAKPVQNARNLPQAAAPTVEANVAVPMTTLLKPSNDQPRLAIPLASDALRLQRPMNGQGSGSQSPSTQPGDIVALGVDPAGPTDQISLPGGNRWGEFSIGPGGKDPGAPGGSAGGAAGAGKGTPGPGGDASVGLGSGVSGGGGNLGGAGTLSIAGPSVGSGSVGRLDPISPMNMVFPVPRTIATRRNAFVVSAGPVGGGSLNVYGALHCGTIYSIFLPMPGKNWSLQYCEKPAVPQKTTTDAPRTVLHLEKPLIPPDVDLAQRFDFKRLPLPLDNSHRSIILQGVIAIDGTVQQLVVHQGVLPQMDEAARIAFRQAGRSRDSGWNPAFGRGRSDQSLNSGHPCVSFWMQKCTRSMSGLGKTGI
jgi:hypothetical protein